jgi:hypothetical protein
MKLFNYVINFTKCDIQKMGVFIYFVITFFITMQNGGCNGKGVGLWMRR